VRSKDRRVGEIVGEPVAPSRRPLATLAGLSCSSAAIVLGCFLTQTLLLPENVAAQSLETETVSPDVESDTSADASTDRDNADVPEELDEDTGIEEFEAPDHEFDDDIETITVTGSAAQRKALDVPVSVTQFDSADIVASGAEDISDLAKFTPNLEIRVAGDTSANFFIRGVGLSDFSANSASAVAIYQDDIAMNSPAIQLGQFYDVERVEVLNGPVGWGSGRNASAGAIKSYARRPSGDYGAQLRTSFGTYQSDDTAQALIQDYEGAVEMPIWEDILSTRLSFRLRAADPFQVNSCGDAPPMSDRVVWDQGVNDIADASICGETNISNGGVSPIPEGLPSLVGDKGNWAARGIFLLTPDIGIENRWLLNVHGGRLDQQSTLGQSIGVGSGNELNRFFGSFSRGDRSRYTEPDQEAELNGLLLRATGSSSMEEFEDLPNLEQRAARALVIPILEKNLAEDRPLDIGPYRGDYNRVGQTTLDSYGGSLRGDVTFDYFDITSLTAYEGYDRFRDTDTDFTPLVIFETIQSDTAWQVSQELKGTSELADGDFRLNSDFLYLHEELDAIMDLLLTPQIILAPNPGFDRVYDQTTDGWYISGGFEWDFLQDFTLEAGARFNWERKKFNIAELNRVPPVALQNVRADQKEMTWSAPTGGINLTYHFNDEVSFYWKYTRGWKSGHFNANNVDADPARPEVIDSVEGGMSGMWLDGLIALRGSIFYYKYKDYQVFVFEDKAGRPPTLEIINANDAEVYGAEINLSTQPLLGFVAETWEQLFIDLRFGWLSSRFLDFTNETEVRTSLGPRVTIADYTGNPLPNSPKYKLSGTARWAFDFGRWGTLEPRYDFAWTDDLYFDPTEGRGSLDNEGQFFKPEFAIGQAGYVLHNFRFAYRLPNGKIELAGWCRNLTDQRYKTFAFDASTIARTTVHFVGDPRTVGFDFIVNF
jgi:outer membrane receptor protein involved in Fe transport